MRPLHPSGGARRKPCAWIAGAAALAGFTVLRPTPADAAGRISERPSIEIEGVLRFPATQLGGSPQALQAEMAPVVEIVSPGTGGFEVTIEASEFRSPQGRTIAPGDIRFEPAGGLLFLESGESGPRETREGGSLDRPVRILAAPPGAKGVFRYSLDPGAFVLHLPDGTYAGAYRGRLTVTMSPGP